MCIALPIQDKFNYDLFFADHIHHFSHKNFEKLLNQSGFSILKYELGRGSYTNIGMYICEKVKKNELSFKYIKNNNLNNIKIILNLTPAFDFNKCILSFSYDKFFTQFQVC